MFKQIRKEDLKLICEELRQSFAEDAKVIDLKNIILESDEYKEDPEFVKEIIQSIIEDRKVREDKQNKLEVEKAKLEIEKLELEKYRFEESRLEKEREFEG